VAKGGWREVEPCARVGWRGKRAERMVYFKGVSAIVGRKKGLVE